MLELVELVGERSDLLHLVVHPLDVFGDVLRLSHDLLHVHGRVIDDPLGAGGSRDAERDKRECDGFLHGVPFVMLCFVSAATRRRLRKVIYHEAEKRRCITCTTCNEVRGKDGNGNSMSVH